MKMFGATAKKVSNFKSSDETKTKTKLDKLIDHHNPQDLLPVGQDTRMTKCEIVEILGTSKLFKMLYKSYQHLPNVHTFTSS